MTIVNDYQSGTVSVPNGATAVTGVGTAWAAADIRPGDMFMRDGYGVVIASVTDNTHLTLAENWPGVTLAGSAYRIRFQPDGSRYTAAARALVERQANGNLDALAQLTGIPDGVPMYTGPGAMTVIPKSDLINGVRYDVQVNTLADRALYNSEATGFSVLVANVGDGRSALYSKKSLTSGDWSAPAYLTGPVGPPVSFTVGDTTTLAPGSDATVVNSGTAAAPVLDFGIPEGEGFHFQGVYSAGTAYAKDDVVTYSGSAYIAKLATTGNVPTNTTYWSLLAAKGLDGDGAGDVVAANNGSEFPDKAAFRANIGANSLPFATNTDDITDFNSLTSPGVQPKMYGGSNPHGPGGLNYYFVENYVYTAGTITQYARPYGLSNIANMFEFRRSRVSGVWSDWVRTATMNDIVDLSMVPVVGGVRATEVADFVNGKYWLNGRNYPSLMSWLHAGDSIFTRGTVAWAQDATARIFKVDPDVPRFGRNAAGVSRGLLVEGGVTNRVSYSEDFSKSVWTKSGCSVLADTAVTSPDGWRQAIDGVYLRIVESAANEQHTFYQQCVTIANAYHTASIFVKAGTRNKGRLYFVAANAGCYVSFDLSTGTIGAPTVVGTGVALSASIEPWPNGWYRIFLTGKVAAGNTGGYIQVAMANASGTEVYTGDGSSYIYAWGAQVEAFEIASSYVPNYTAVTGSRANEICYCYREVQPTAITKVIKARTATSLPPSPSLLWHMDDGTEANDFEIYRDANGHIYLQLRVNWAEQATLDLGFVANATDFKIALRGSSAGIAASINGGAVVASSIAVWPSTLVVERYGINATVDRFWFATIAYEATIPTAATNGELQALSA